MSVKYMTRATLPEFSERLRRIPPETRPLWGRLTPHRLMSHLLVQLRMALEELQVPDQSNWFTSTVLRYLVFHVMPWPKGRVKAPDYFLPEPNGDFETERDQLLRALEQFVEAAEKEPDRRVQNPVFGLQPLHRWQRMVGMHFDHHLRQFGV